jgi:hypothetical protein
VQFDRVRRDARLSVLKIEEGDTGNLSLRAKSNLAAGDPHLTTPIRGRSPVALRGRRLGDHVLPAWPKNEMEIAIRLASDVCDGSADSELVTLERKPRRR